ncbi:hypothetical protein ACFPRL_32830 [Pseudoclavibacter helvolus]
MAAAHGWRVPVHPGPAHRVLLAAALLRARPPGGLHEGLGQGRHHHVPALLLRGSRKAPPHSCLRSLRPQRHRPLTS